MFVLCKRLRNADVGCSRLQCRLMIYGPDSLVVRGLSIIMAHYLPTGRRHWLKTAEVSFTGGFHP
jgi:hypothetical protein